MRKHNSFLIGGYMVQQSLDNLDWWVHECSDLWTDWTCSFCTSIQKMYLSKPKDGCDSLLAGTPVRSSLFTDRPQLFLQWLRYPSNINGVLAVSIFIAFFPPTIPLHSYVNNNNIRVQERLILDLFCLSKQILRNARH